MANKQTFASGEGKIELSLDEGQTYQELLDVESFSLSTDVSDETWNAFNNGGFQSAYVTSKALTASVEKKLRLDQLVDNQILSLAINGNASNHNYAKIKFTFPNIDQSVGVVPASIEFEGTIKTSDIASQGSTEMSPLNFEINSNGRPSYTEEVIPVDIPIVEADLNITWTGADGSIDYTFDNPVGNGNINVSASPAGGTLNVGADVTFTLTPASGYTVNGKLTDDIVVQAQAGA